MVKYKESINLLVLQKIIGSDVFEIVSKENSLYNFGLLLKRYCQVFSWEFCGEISRGILTSIFRREIRNSSLFLLKLVAESNQHVFYENFG